MEMPLDLQKYERARRLINFGQWLTDIDLNKTRLIIRFKNLNFTVMVSYVSFFTEKKTWISK